MNPQNYNDLKKIIRFSAIILGFTLFSIVSAALIMDIIKRFIALSSSENFIISVIALTTIPILISIVIISETDLNWV